MSPTYVIVPGLRDHVEDHWQTHLAARLPRSVTVSPLTEDKMSLAARVAKLDSVIASIEGAVVLVAHSAGVMMVAHWAAEHRGEIVGALLACPADVESPFPDGYPTTETLTAHGWLPVPRAKLPFPSLLAASENDVLCPFTRAERMAADWGSILVNLGAVGHLNPVAGFGVWHDAEALLRRVSVAGQMRRDCASFIS